MAPPGISFEVTPPALAADPNRMDIAMFVGLLPLREGGEAARQGIAARLAAEGWAARADEALRDVPVRVRGIDEVEALWDTGGRLDRVAAVRGLGLLPEVEIPAADTVLTVNVDGVDTSVSLAAGPVARADLRDILAEALTGVSISLAEPDAQGRAALVVARTAPGPGAITVYANPTLGFPVAARDAATATGCPMGAALRGFFAAGGREAVVIAMGDPAPLFANAGARVAALQTLIAGLVPGAAALADLAGGGLPGLPGAYPPRDPWHGLAHLHGLDDVAMVLLPDLAELVSTVPAVAAETAPTIRPPARFQVCAPEAPLTADGQANPGAPSQADATGVAVWGRFAAWAAAQTARITPEATVIAAAPLAAEGGTAAIADLVAADAALAHPQLQIATPWTVSRLFGDMPGRAAPGDGLLAGAIAASTLADGAWRTVAGTALPMVSKLLDAGPRVTAESPPALTQFGYGVGSVQILSDRTTDQDRYPQANVRRLMALILRAARHRGEGMVFEANGPLLWRDTIMTLTTLLRGLHNAGALAGVGEDEAFTVLCGPETMSQADMDAGRVIADVSVRPAHSLESIEIRFIARGGVLAPRSAA